MIQMENNEVKNTNWKEMDQLHGSIKFGGEKSRPFQGPKS